MACRVNLGKKTVSSKCSGGDGVVIAGGSPSPSSRHQKDNTSPFATLNKETDHLRNPVLKESTVTHRSAAGQVDDMAGDIRIHDGKKQRRMWTLRDRSDMSVHFLKANLAEDGCEEAQLDVAKKLLQDCSRDDSNLMDNTLGENSRLAVYWLVKSSEQGNVEATHLLQECLSSGRGITEQNILDVKTCISTPTNEKLTYNAARLLYLKLNNGEKFITTTQLLSRINLIKKPVDFYEENESDSDESSPNTSFNDITEDVSEGGKRSSRNADVPSENIGLNQTFTYPNSHHDGFCENDPEDDDQVAHSKLYSNQEAEKLTLEDLLRVAGSFNSGQSPRPAMDSENKELPRHNWKFGSHLNAFIAQFLIVCALNGVLTWRACGLIGSAFVSLWASFNLLSWRKRQSNFQDWSTAFGSIQHDNKVWSEKKAEKRFIINLFLPYLISMIASLTVFYVVDGHNTLKFVTGGLVMFAFWHGAFQSKILSFRVGLFFAIISASKFLPLIATYCNTTNFLDLNLGVEEQLVSMSKLFKEYFGHWDLPNFNLLPIVQLLLILTLLWSDQCTLIRRNLPELLVAVWLKTLSEITLESNEFDIMDIEVNFMLVFVLIGVLLILHSKLDTLRVILSLTVLVGFAFVLVTFILSLTNQTSFKVLLNKLENFNYPVATSQLDIEQLLLIEWEEYDKNCHRKAWKLSSPAATQIACFTKYGGKDLGAVRWRGRITVVKVREMKKSFGSDSLENISFDIIVNIIHPEGNLESKSWQSFLPGSESEHPSPATILVSTMSTHKKDRKQMLTKYILNLRTGDKIEFFGVLNPLSAGGLRPEIVDVHSLKCISCVLLNESEFFLTESTSEWGQAPGSTYNSDVKTTLNSTYNGIINLLISVVDSFKSIIFQ